MNRPADQATAIADIDAALAAGYLLADMNHEIRTSMNGIVGMLTLLRDTELTASQREYATLAQNSVDTLLELIERIVDMSLIEANQFALASAPFDLRQEMQAACANKNIAAHGKGLQLTVNFPPSVLLDGDAARLRQVIAGLTDSALRLSERGQIMVSADAACEQGSHCRLCVKVHAAELSEAGEQLASVLNQPLKSGIATLRRHGKTTLELALCAQLARLMGGRIGVESLPRQGTTFWFTIELPLAPSPLAGVRILLAAEPSAERSAFLAQHGDMYMDCADSATDALTAMGRAAAQQAPYRIVLLDHQIKGMDGELLGTAIKAEPAYRDTLLVLLTDQLEKNITRFVQAGFSALMAKSAPPQAQLSALSRLCSAAKSGRVPPFITTDTPAGMPAPPSGELPHPFAGRRILVADDNLVNQQIAVRMLEKLGCKADVANHGQEAVDMQRAACYELVLMDCEMPELDGYQATERIRTMEGTSRHTPVVALTACTTQGEREKCLACGMDDFLSKPIRPLLLKETLERWLPSITELPLESAANNCSDELDAVREMFGADFSELAALYQNDSPPRIAALHRAHAAGDCVQVAKTAHAFSGSSASIGATGLSALCKQLEISAKLELLDDFKIRLSAIEAEYRRVSGKIQSMLT